MKEKHCYDEECKNYWSCKYLKHRFNIAECDRSINFSVSYRHAIEIREREEMLKELNQSR